MLLLRLHRLAGRLQRLRRFLPVLAGAGFLAALLSLRGQDELHSLALRLSLVFSLWCLMLFAAIRIFHVLPPPVLPLDRWYVRALARIRIACYQGLAIFTLLVGLLVVQLGLKLLLID